MSFKQFLTESLSKAWVVYDFAQGVGNDKSVLQLFASESSAVNFLKQYFDEVKIEFSNIAKFKFTDEEDNEYAKIKTIKQLDSFMMKRNININNFLYISQHNISK